MSGPQLCMITSMIRAKAHAAVIKNMIIAIGLNILFLKIWGGVCPAPSDVD